jgi:hypothetical protein
LLLLRSIGAGWFGTQARNARVPVGLWKGDENEFAVLLGAQWPSRRRPSGAAALAVALLGSAARDAGLLTATAAKHTRPRQRATAQALPRRPQRWQRSRAIGDRVRPRRPGR